MPDMPPTLGRKGTRTDRRRVYDRERQANHQWRNWYKLAAWLRRRLDQLMREPLCKRCRAQGILTAATVANHKEPHRGDWHKFINGELESVCKPCHDSVIQSEERKGNAAK